VPIPEVDQNPQDDYVYGITDQGDHGVFHILATDGPDPLIVRLKSPAEVKDEITGHCNNKRECGCPKVIKIEQIN
jgi:hypothetical protein